MGSRACAIRVQLLSGDPAAETPGKPESVTARALVCRCFAGRHLSVTCRKISGDDPAEEQPDQAFPWPGIKLLSPAGNVPLDEVPADEREQRIAKSTDALLGELWRKLEFGKKPRLPLTGLIVIAGRTGSGKSDIARAFIRRYLTHVIQEPESRRPHLLTYEDPIEKPLASSPEDAASRGFDYTPREKLIDAGNLREATRDALRQTPTLFFVGETRDEQDWQELLRFAGTGHLTITTGHAGSLVETMAQVLHAAKARTPAERSRVAGRLAALIHIRPHFTEGRDRVLIPAFWFRTSRSISAFTAEGLGSLLPNGPGGKIPRDSYGRAHAVQSLKYLQDIPGLLETAVEWDLRGD